VKFLFFYLYAWNIVYIQNVFAKNNGYSVEYLELRWARPRLYHHIRPLAVEVILNLAAKCPELKAKARLPRCTVDPAYIMSFDPGYKSHCQSPNFIYHPVCPSSISFSFMIPPSAVLTMFLEGRGDTRCITSIKLVTFQHMSSPVPSC